MRMITEFLHTFSRNPSVDGAQCVPPCVPLGRAVLANVEGKETKFQIRRRIFNCGVEVKRGYFVAQKRTSNN